MFVRGVKLFSQFDVTLKIFLPYLQLKCTESSSFAKGIRNASGKKIQSALEKGNISNGSEIGNSSVRSK